MDELTLNPEFLRSLILKARALMAQSGMVTPDVGSNLTDDENAPDMLQDGPNNPLRREIVEQITDLEPDQRDELVALMWIGRGDLEAEEWEEALRLAAERREASPEASTAEYLLDHPHFPDHLDEGVDRLYDGSDLMETGEY
jgi:hypothetical protein